MGLHQAIALCMDHCHSAEIAGESDWFKTVVLSGGTACLPGLAGKYPFYVAFYVFASQQKNEMGLMYCKNTW